ncbi:hypothetical protein EX30DRAFT_239918 [Ascodesmis nigricans]|uniref:non-specific serine/threonine protein kinase n=1 Tax=Ascodesmis nigricans TaxID=341454 RepID=A0A4S2MYS7_9PEZI|nr:hypothetical protein EX30DRAFT_239918 [Ascodesmis nigricans]
MSEQITDTTTVWRKCFRIFHGNLILMNEYYPDSPNGHTAAASAILDGSDPALIGSLRKSFTLLHASVGVGVTQEFVTVANNTMNAIDSQHPMAHKKDSLTNLIEVIYKFYSNDGRSTPLNIQILIDAASAFVQNVSVMVPPPSIPVQPSFQSTPIKSNLASNTQTSNTHKILDQKLENELRGHLWTADHSFFDHFFPEIPGLPLPKASFPKVPTETAVVNWFMDYQQLLSDHHKPLSTVTWAASGQRHLEGPDTRRAVDLFTYKHDPMNPDSLEPGKHHWSGVIAVGELKYRSKHNGLSDFDTGLIIQLVNYVREVFKSQLGRRFVHGYTLINASMRCWVFTRSGGVVSPRLTLTKHADLKTFSRVFYGYLHNPDLGLAKADDPAMRAIKLNGKELQLGDIFFSTTAIVTRATMCRHAYFAPQSPDMLVLKSSWRYETRHNEGDLLKEAAEAGVKGIAIYSGHEDRESVHGILGKVHITGTIQLRKHKRSVTSAVSRSSTKRTRNSTPAPESGSSKRRKTSTNSRATEVYATEIEYEFKELPKPNLVIPNRIHTHLLISPGISITDVKDPLDLLLTMRDAIRGHRSLLTNAGILHRDISINNIMMTRPSHPRPDGFHGFLIDLDLAVRVDRKKASGAPDRTGTYEFLSLDLLKAKPGHYFHDDLQSFYFVLIWLAHDHAGGTNLLEQWGGDSQAAANAKGVQVYSENDFNELLQSFILQMGIEVKTVVTKFRSALWPETASVRKAIKRQDVEEYKDMFYNKIDQAFMEGIRKLEARRTTKMGDEDGPKAGTGDENGSGSGIEAGIKTELRAGTGLSAELGTESSVGMSAGRVRRNRRRGTSSRAETRGRVRGRRSG